MEGQYRIAIYGHKRIPSREGGIEVVVQELAVRLARQGNQVTCMNRGYESAEERKQDEPRKHEVYQGVRILSLPTIHRSGLAAVSSSFFAAWKVAFGPYDLVHIHAEGPAAFCQIPRLFGKKVVVTIHGLDWQRDKWHGFAKQFIHFGEKMAARHADAMIVLSQNMQDYFRTVYGRETVYIPNGVESALPLEADGIRRTMGLEKDGYVLYLGRLVPEKQADTLIRAFRKTRGGKKLVIAGPLTESDEYHQLLKELAQGDDRILFAGFVEGKLLQELYSNAYLYVLPSKLEGMPLSLLEAMSFGCCCVTTNIPECREVIGDLGFLVDPGDEVQLEKLLQELMDDPVRVEETRKKTLEQIRKRGGWDEVTEETQQLYRRLMETKKGRGCK